MKALGYRLIAKIEELPEKTREGIIIPDSVRSREKMALNVGTVVEIGPQCWEGQAPWVGPGDRIVFGKYAAKHFEHPDTKEQYILLNDEDVIAKL
jgi:chaperonin GroES